MYFFAYALLLAAQFCSLACAGLAILMFFFCLWLSKALVKGTGKFFVGLKARLMRKEKTE